MPRAQHTKHNKGDELLETSDAGRILGITGEGVRALVRRGRLTCFITTSGGRRLFRRRDMERFRDQRKQAQTKAA